MKVLHSALSLCILLTVAVSVADSETSTDFPTTTPKSFLDNVILFLNLKEWINTLECAYELIENVLKNDTALHFVFYISADDEAQFITIFHDFIAKFPTFGFFRNCSLVSGLSSMSKCMNKQIKALQTLVKKCMITVFTIILLPLRKFSVYYVLEFESFNLRLDMTDIYLLIFKWLILLVWLLSWILCKKRKYLNQLKIDYFVNGIVSATISTLLLFTPLLIEQVQFGEESNEKAEHSVAVNTIFMSIYQPFVWILAAYFSYLKSIIALFQTKETAVMAFRMSYIPC
ncbi:unnamed protein product [Caenorhabditis sp. 36 PRJEB53466]|nr:unnamed protein product [Caenorhabditis sp. 36 PRJEB53466]